MKAIALLAALGLCLAMALHAEEAVPANAGATVKRTPEALDTLLGPIALYPDALVALMLPAATSPSDVVLASRYLQAGNDLAAVENQAWSESVKALVHYPDVLKWMNQNLEWTQALGQAFLDQPADVMNSVQRLRVRARDSGALVSTPQQTVLDEDGHIVIEPARPDVIYVPVYDPAVVYVRRTVWVDDPFLVFAFSYPIGPWFIYDCDWSRRTVWVSVPPPDWRSHPRYWHHVESHRSQPPPGRAWHPPANYHPRPIAPVYAHPPTPNPIRIDPKNLPSADHVFPHGSTIPRHSDSPGTAPHAPNRPAYVPNDHDHHPVTPAPPGTVSPAVPAPPMTVSPPVVAPPPATVIPSRPRWAEPYDRSHHRIWSAPIIRSIPEPHMAPPVPEPAPATNAGSTQVGPRPKKYDH